MANTPVLPSVKTLLNYADSAASRSHAHRSASSQFHSSPSKSNHSSRHATRPDKLSSRSFHSSSSRYEPHQQQYLPSVHEVLHGVPSKHVPSSHRSNSSKSTYASMEGVEYDRKSRESTSSTKKQGYPCERCGRLFTRKSDALKHIRVVHDRLKVFACSVCGRKFARKDYCTKHEKSLHNITPPPTQYQLRRQASKEQAESRHRMH